MNGILGLSLWLPLLAVAYGQVNSYIDDLKRKHKDELNDVLPIPQSTYVVNVPTETVTVSSVVELNPDVVAYNPHYIEDVIRHIKRSIADRIEQSMEINISKDESPFRRSRVEGKIRVVLPNKDYKNGY